MMQDMIAKLGCPPVVLVAAVFVQTAYSQPGSTDRRAEVIAHRLIDQSGIVGGMVLHLGSEDGRLTAALRRDERFVVQGLERDRRKVEQGRRFLHDVGVNGPVSIRHWDGRRLPYAENLVNLIVAEDSGNVAVEEMLRVLAPRGVLLRKHDEGWAKTVKPVPAEIDDWSHFLHGPTNNAVSSDRTVGPPRHMQWVCGPRFARSHEITSSLAGMVSSGGRLFYIWDEGPIAVLDPRLPQKWSLIARDAFNGAVLWRRPMPRWGWRQWHDPELWNDAKLRGRMLVNSPPTLPRRMVASEDRLYITLGYDAPVSVLDSATGQELDTFGDTALTDEILLDGRHLVLRVRTADSPPERNFWEKMSDVPRGRVMVLDALSGRKRWQSPADDMTPLTLAVSEDRVYYCNYREIVCLDLGSGQERWRSESVDSPNGRKTYGGTLVAAGGVVLYTTVGGSTFSFDGETGRLLWKGPNARGVAPDNPPDLFLADNLVWLSETDPSRLGSDPDLKQTAMDRQGLDPRSGEAIRDISVPCLMSPGHHYRCYRSKATQDFLLLPKRGVEFVDLDGDNHMRNDWLRAPCTYGVLPANGLLYTAPHQCVCYPGVLLSHFNVMAPELPSEMAARPPAPKGQLRKGPAYGSDALDLEVEPGDWPAYRHDALRSGSVDVHVPAQLETVWETPLGGRLTPPVAADGRLYVAQIDRHTVHALDADTGRRRWHFTAGGRVDSAPTLLGSLVIFGSSDGSVYCLQSETGELRWRFLAAPHDRFVAADGQFESAWPVHGSVLVQNDATSARPRPVAYFCAGRSSFLDGGIDLYGLDPRSGEMLYHARLDGPHPNPRTDVGKSGYMDGAKSDILASDGVDLYLYQNRFRGDLKAVDTPLQSLGAQGGGYRVFTPDPQRGSHGRHLIVTGGFLDDSFNEGTFWTYSGRWPGWDRQMGRVRSFGQLMVFDDSASYGVNYYTLRTRVRRSLVPGEIGYRVFARNHDADEDTWSVFQPIRAQAMVLTADKLFVAGPPDVMPGEDPAASFEGRLGTVLAALSKSTGESLATRHLSELPVFDGLIATAGRLYLSTASGQIVCLAGAEDRKATP